jgi:hypothetical protein
VIRCVSVRLEVMGFSFVKDKVFLFLRFLKTINEGRQLKMFAFVIDFYRRAS